MKIYIFEKKAKRQKNAADLGFLGFVILADRHRLPIVSRLVYRAQKGASYQ